MSGLVANPHMAFPIGAKTREEEIIQIAFARYEYPWPEITSNCCEAPVVTWYYWARDMISRLTLCAKCLKKTSLVMHPEEFERSVSSDMIRMGLEAKE